MLYDPKWTAKEKTLDGFIAWLEQQPSDGTYDYTKPDKCAVAQWLQSLGEEHYIITSLQIRELFGPGGEFIVNNPRSETFGGALDRARHYRAQSLASA